MSHHDEKRGRGFLSTQPAENTDILDAEFLTLGFSYNGRRVGVTVGFVSSESFCQYLNAKVDALEYAHHTLDRVP